MNFKSSFFLNLSTEHNIANSSSPFSHYSELKNPFSELNTPEGVRELLEEEVELHHMNVDLLWLYRLTLVVELVVGHVGFSRPHSRSFLFYYCAVISRGAPTSSQRHVTEFSSLSTPISR